MKGTEKILNKLITAVNEIERATSPFAHLVSILDTTPPAAAAITITPIAISIGELNIFIKGVQLKSDNLRVNSFCQIYNESGIWVDQATLPLKDREIENAILNNAKKIKLSLN